MISARLGSAQPATGMGYELDAIAAVVIGGTSLSGGRGTVVGTMIGALIISVLTNGLQILSIPQEWQEDRKSTRLNSSHVAISYAVFCLKKKNTKQDGYNVA